MEGQVQSTVNWDELLKNLETLKKSLEGETEEEQQAQEVVKEEEREEEQVNYNSSSYKENEHKAQLDYWVNLGRQLFITKYGGMPNIQKYLPIIESKALYKAEQDYKQGRLRDNYISYLEEALKETLQEAISISQDFSNLARYINTTQATKIVQKPYTTEDYYDDYKKMLEQITVKNVAHIRFDDGSKHSGYWGEPKLNLGEVPKIE